MQIQRKYIIFVGESRLLFQSLPEGEGFTDYALDAITPDSLKGIGDKFKGTWDRLNGLTKAVGTGVDAALVTAQAAAMLASTLSTVILMTTEGVSKGVVYTVDGAKQVIEWGKDKWIGEADILPDFNYYIKNYFTGGLVPENFRFEGKQPDSNLLEFMSCEYNMAILDALLFQTKTFYDPVLYEFRKVEAEINRRNRIKHANSRKEAELKGAIEDKKSLIENGEYTDAIELRTIQLEKQVAERALSKLQQQYSLDVIWNRPELRETEFPPGSGIPIPRFVPGSEKVKLNLDDLYGSLKVYSVEFEPYLERYAEEKNRWEYKAAKRRLKSEEYFKKHEPELKAYHEALKVKVKEIKSGGDRNFKSEKPEPMYHLIEEAFEARRTAVKAPKITRDYLAWNVSKIIPDKLVEYGCVAEGDKIMYYKGELTFELKILPDGAVMSGWTDESGVKHEMVLPYDLDPHEESNWIPKKLYDYGVRFEDGKLVKDVKMADGEGKDAGSRRMYFEIQPDDSILMIPEDSIENVFILPPGGNIRDLTGADGKVVTSQDWKVLIPKKMLDYGCRFEDGKIVKDIVMNNGVTVRWTYETQPDYSVIATPNNSKWTKLKLGTHDDPNDGSKWKPVTGSADDSDQSGGEDGSAGKEGDKTVIEDPRGISGWRH